MRSRVVVMVAAALLLIAGPSQAKGKAEAKEAFKRALQHYNLGDFTSALDGFKEAYLDYPDASLLFNIGQCQRQLGMKQEALLSYKAYLREAGEPSNRDEVMLLIHNLEQAIRDDDAARRAKPADSGAKAPEPTITPPPVAPTLTATAPPRRAPVYRRWWLWTAVGVVVAGAGVGLAVGLSSSSTHFPSATPSDGTIRF